MEHHKKRLNKSKVWIIAACVALCVAGALLMFFKALISDNGSKHKRQVQMVTLLTPPPPPKIEEKLPEPEKEKQEKIEEKPDEQVPDQAEDAADDTPPGEELGLDADSTGGSDSFGLKAKKGGRSLIGGGGNALYSWYTNVYSNELQKLFNKIIQERGGLPGDKLKVIVQVFVGPNGEIVNYTIVGSSGNAKMDKAVTDALKSVTIGEPPPPGMPPIMKFEISSQG